MSCTRETGRLKMNPKHSRGSHSENVEEIYLTIDDLKVCDQQTRSTKKSSTRIEQRLLAKHSESQSRIAQKRLSIKSNELGTLKFIPEISRTSAKIIMPRYQSEIKMMAESMRKVSIIEELEIEVKFDIPKPDPETIKESFKLSRTNSCDGQQHRTNLLAMNLIDKNKYYSARKERAIIEAQKKRKEEIERNCSFKPDLSKTSSQNRKSAQSLPQYIHTEERFKYEDSIISAAPKPESVKNTPLIEPTNKFIKVPTYSQISPSKNTYSFKEGVNIKKLIEKSRPMMRYNIIT